MLSGIIAKKIIKIDQIMAREYGAKKYRGGSDPLTELVRTILSQNTNDRNRDRAFANLEKEFPSWDALYRAQIAKISTSIKVAGLAKIRANRISKLLKFIYDSESNFDLNFLRKWPDEKIKSYLRAIDGVGPKTAACVMAFSLGRNVMPVDTHVYRVSQRLGLFRSKTSIEKVHDFFVQFGNVVSLYQLHLNLIAHGRTICHARAPLCSECDLKRLCAYYLHSAKTPKIEQNETKKHKIATNKH